MGGGPPGGDDPQPLPELRPELRLHPGAPTILGAPTFLVEDPIRHRFVQVDIETHDLIGLMRGCETVEDLRVAARVELSLDLDSETIDQFIAFLHAYDLTGRPAVGGWRHYHTKAHKGKSLWWVQLAHKYLFFRIPLWRPQAFLEATLPSIAWLFTRAFLWITCTVGVVGIYLVSRQWDTFVAAASGLFTWQGTAAFLVALVGVKAIHELGHAYAAIRLGCRVPTIGIAFMLLFPMPYTDVTDAWRLKRRGERLAVDGAGIAAELTIAVYSTFLWVFLPDGSLKAAAFMLATASWVMSLMLNLNPFMRFDGYYLLSDAVGIENLQPRSFAVAKWYLKETLFRLNDAPPEPFPSRALSAMALYGYCVWIYRFFLFLAIAIIVYYSTFKVLGILLFILEIILLIAKPVVAELKVWWQLRDRIMKTRRTLIAGGVVALALAAFVVPWSSAVIVPAIVSLQDREPVHPEAAGRLVALHVAPGDLVAVGQVIARLERPDLEQRLSTVARRLAATEVRLGRGAADEHERLQTIVLERERNALIAERDGLEAQRRAMILRAPIAGQVLEMATNLHKGRWLSTAERVALIGAPAGLEASGYVTEVDAWRIEPGTLGHFIPDHVLAAGMAVTLRTVAARGAATIDIPELSNQFGGRIAVTADPEGTLVPSEAQYRVVATVVTSGQPVRATGTSLRGVIHFDGRRQSFAARLWRQILKVVARETGA